MEFMTAVKLTKTEIAVLSRAHEILEELGTTLPSCHHAYEPTGEAFAYLGVVISYLSAMGNDFPFLHEEKDDPQPEELLEDCWEFTAERPDYPKSLDYSWKGTVPESY